MTEDLRLILEETYREIVVLRNTTPKTAEEYNRNRLKFDALSLRLESIQLEINAAKLLEQGVINE